MIRQVPSGGSELLRKQQAIRRRIRRHNPDVRVSQGIVYAGYRQHPFDIDDFPAAKAFLKMYSDGTRGSTKMAIEACRIAGLSYNSAAKAAKRVERELHKIGEHAKWRNAKKKSGRPALRVK